MRKTISILTSALMAMSLTAAPSYAHEFKLGDLQIKHPWSRATPKSAKVGGGYLTVINHGTMPDRLVSVSSPAAGKVELHQMTVQDGIMTMRPLPDGITIEPGKTVAFAPGGLHIMFLDLAAPFEQGKAFAAKLIFENAGEVDVRFAVEAIGTREGPDHHGPGGHGR